MCMTALAALLMTSATAFAATTAKITDDGYNVATDMAEGKKTVLITKDDDDAIVYVGQNDSAYSAVSEFLLKADAADGKYTIRLGDGTDKTAEKAIFYIGMQNTGIDVLLTKPAIGATSSDGKSIGYTASDVTGTYQTVIIQKSDNKYYGVSLGGGTVITVKNAAVGIQINGVDNSSDILNVWLSGRGIVTAQAADNTEK
ncbi:MAG: hypothetical protein SOS24_03635 [Clostridia bacterium]|nr:hypothetical protein [Clostridia bacterium]